MNPIVIIGAGLSGLAAALELTTLGYPVCLFEQDSTVGGRVKTRNLDGYTIDQGFQVYLNAYPRANSLLDLSALQLRSFHAGAKVRFAGKWHTLVDSNRPSSLAGLVGSAVCPIGSLADKLKLAKLRDELLCLNPLAQMDSIEGSTLQFLQQYGFSEAFIERFFRPWLGGIFLEKELNTSAQFFQFVMAMFSRDGASLPEKGMAAIPAQLAAKLPQNSLYLNAKVDAIEGDYICVGGEKKKAAAIILACEPHIAKKFLPQIPVVEMKSATSLFFTANKRSSQRFLHLNGTGRGLVNHVAFPSAVQANYAPKNKQLLHATILGKRDPQDLIRPIANELRNWFPRIEGLKFLTSEVISHALPRQKQAKILPFEFELQYKNIFLAGDYTCHGSIEGAIESGQLAASAALLYSQGRTKQTYLD